MAVYMNVSLIVYIVVSKHFVAFLCTYVAQPMFIITYLYLMVLEICRMKLAIGSYIVIGASYELVMLPFSKTSVALLLLFINKYVAQKD